MAKVSREVTLERREKVKELYFIRNYTIAEVAKVLNWNPQTIWDDIEAIRESFSKQITVITVKSILERLIRVRLKVIQRLWKAYDNAVNNDDSKGEINSLKAIDDIERRMIEDLINLGFIPKPTDNINIKEQRTELLFRLREIMDGKPITSKEQTKRKRANIKFEKSMEQR